MLTILMLAHNCLLPFRIIENLDDGNIHLLQIGKCTAKNYHFMMMVSQGLSERLFNLHLGWHG